MKVLISAGGTGGHILPAQQLADKLLEKGNVVVFAAKDLSNRKLFKKDKYKFYDISSYFFTKNLFKFSYFILKGLFQSLKLIIRYKPDVVVGFGSYHTFPVMLAAVILRKKIVLFEANTTLGKVNRFFSKFSIVTTQFDVSGNNVLVNRLPWKSPKVKYEDIFQKTQLEKDVFTILIFGGSQGARIINEAFIDIANDLRKNYKFQIVHLTGPGQDIKKIKQAYLSYNIKAYVSSYEENMHLFFQNVDLVISRAGASAIAEVLQYNLPSILIPFERASENHQNKNALFMQNEIKGAIKINQSLLNKDLLRNLEDLLSNQRKKNILLKSNIEKFKSLEKKEEKTNLEDLIINIRR